MYVSRIVQALHAEPFLERVHEVRVGTSWHWDLFPIGLQQVREALSVLAEQGIICQCAPDLFALTE